jgi:hypothetical protein
MGKKERSYTIGYQDCNLIFIKADLKYQLTKLISIVTFDDKEQSGQRARPTEDRGSSCPGVFGNVKNTGWGNAVSAQ